MVKIKSFTDISKSKKLAEILPLESADMRYEYPSIEKDEIQEPMNGFHTSSFNWFKESDSFIYIPCWSLAAILEQLPYELCDDDGNSVYLQIDKEDDVYQLVYTDPYGDFESIETDRYEHFIDACVDMIEKLNELKLF